MNPVADVPAVPRPARLAKPAKPQTVLEVLRRTHLNPWMVRLTLGGAGLASFAANAYTDQYVKIVFVDPALGLTPPYDLSALRASLPPEQRPVTRTYTVRRVTPEGLDIDFVVHGEDGLAAPWAARAEIGERVVLAGPGGAYAPRPDADWHLLTGDASAIPAIAAACEQLPADARGFVLIVIGHDGEQQALEVPAGVAVHWHVHPEAAANPEVLRDLITEHPWPAGTPHVFAHGERESIKLLRRLFKERGVAREHLSISGYWAYGRTEDTFQAEKREPIGKIEPDDM